MSMHRDPQRRSRGVGAFVLSAAALLSLASATQGQAPATPPAPPASPAKETDAPETIKPGDRDSDQLYGQQQKLRATAERELKKLRGTHFKNIRNPKIRADGITKLYDYDQPALYPSLIEIFQHEGEDVRTALLDMFAASASDEGDASLAWLAIEAEDPAFRQMAKARLQQRISAGYGKSNRVHLVIMQGLRSQNDARVASAAQLAQNLGLFQTIPWLIQAQVGGTSTGGGGGTGNGRGSLAYILVGQQQAFISDLTPVVGQSAVAFDPQLSTLTTGTILQVFDAVVVTYRTEVHSALLGLSQGLSGRDLSGLGWDQPGWWKWYIDEGKGLIAAKQAASDKAKTEAPAATEPK